jgi:GDP-4-dehydro-6-deoxy-D-mannose reductase
VRVLITGITGFVGSHLAEYLLSTDESGRVEVYGTGRHRSPLDNISGILDRVSLIQGVDIRDAHAVEAAIKEAEPDYIFHLAAQSFVPASWISPTDTIATNVTGTVNLLEAARRSQLNPIIQIAGSSEEYGCPPLIEDTSHITFGVNQTPKMVFKMPINEDFPLLPLSPYGVSKVAEDLLGFQYHKSYGMKIVRTRAFNHTGPRRGEYFVTSNFAKQIAEIEKGKRDPVVKVGNLEATRDFTDVRDIVRGYWLAASRGKYGEVYNICSGKARSWTR